MHCTCQIWPIAIVDWYGGITQKLYREFTLSHIGQSKSSRSFHFWLLVMFLTLVFFTGGTARIDAMSLLILRPISVVLCAVAMMTLCRNDLVQNKWLLIGFGVVAATAALHLVPLPPPIWEGLAGRVDAQAVDALVGLENIWRPVTLTPMNAWHALASLFAPAAILLLGIQLNRDDLYRLLPVLIALGALSGLIGMLQVIGSPEGPLYFYRITNNGAAVGLFANRNHAATLLACLFPMLAVFAATTKGKIDEQNRRRVFAFAIAIVLVPLILVTGSRSGLILALVGLGMAPLLISQPLARKGPKQGGVPSKRQFVTVFAALAIVCVGLLTIFFSRAEALDRFFAESTGVDNRNDFWLVSLDLFWKYFPVGSGSGSFVEVFQIAEPTRLLDATYLNHVHNDWIEIAVTFGLPGLTMAAIGLLFFVRRTFIVWRKMDGARRSVVFARLASFLIAMLALASLSDYPVRTPTLMCVLAIMMLWFVEAGHERDDAARPITAKE